LDGPRLGITSNAARRPSGTRRRYGVQSDAPWRPCDDDDDEAVFMARARARARSRSVKK
jgi:hypothetical protein